MIDIVTRMIGAIRPAIARLGVGVLTIAVLALTGCARGSVQDALGMGKQAPDEFSVAARQPLIIPPDFDLRPPTPGEGQPAAGTTGDQARATLLGQSAAPAAIRPAVAAPGAESPGQQALLTEAGAGKSDPNVRRQIAEENQSLAQIEDALFTRVMKWREPSTLGATVDAPAETARLRANRAKGEPPTAGDTPTIVERRQSPLGALVSKVF